MNHLRINFWRAACCTGILALTAPAYADDGRTENFATNWPSEVTGSAFTYVPVTNPVTQWVINGAQLTNFGSAVSLPYVAQIATNAAGNGWVQSPQFTNGIGKFVFYARPSTGLAIPFIVESSTNGIDWSTNSSYSVSVSTAWMGFTNTFNTYSNLYLRIRKTADNFNRLLRIDNCSVSYPPAQLTVTDASIVPAVPLNGDAVTVNAHISVVGLMTNAPILNAFWRDLFSPTWNSLAMDTNAAGAYATADNAIPARTAGAVVEYYVQAVYDDGYGTMITNTYPPTGAATPSAYAVKERSQFTNMMVQGTVTTNMLLVSPYQWQAAAPAASRTNPFFAFRGVSNAVPVTWGDTNQSVFSLPAYGTAEITPTNITLAGVVDSALSFRFNEQSGAYIIQPCTYENLASWTNRPAGIYTNNGWVLSNGLIANDAARALQGSYAVLNTNSFFQSPYLTNGIGQISFWFRSFVNGGNPTGVIAIQKAASPTSTWSDAAFFTTNTTSTNYLYVNVGQSDRDSHVIRIVNNVNSNNAPVCLDEVIVCEPGAGVTYSNLVSTPSPATILDSVNIEVNIDAQGGATNLQAWTLFRFGTNGTYETLSMTNTGNHFVTTEPIPRAGTGTVQYMVLCSHTGFQSEASSPVYLPAGPNSPNEYIVQSPNDGRTENFGTNWPSEVTGSAYTYTPVTNPVTQWVINYAQLTNSAQALSSPYVAQIQETSTDGRGWVQSPQFTNGIGSIVFYARTTRAVDVSFSVESSVNGVDWNTNALYTVNNQNAWVGFTNTLNTTSNLYLRIRKLTDGVNRFLRIDNCSVSYPPSRVAVTNVYIDPGYPSTADTVNVSCVVTSLNPMFPAVNIVPTLHYRRGGDSTYTAIPMTRGTGIQYSTALAGSIPRFPRDTRIEYFVRCDFNGYHGSDAENQSPAFSPAGGSNAPSSYVVRVAKSAYDTIGMMVNGQLTAGRMLPNGTWQAVATISSVATQLTASIVGFGYSTGTGYASIPIVWGNNNNWQTNVPLVDVAGTNQTTLTINGAFQGQYMLHFDEFTGEYQIEKCVWQGFDWQPDDTQDKYVKKAVSRIAGGASLSFDSWSVNTSTSRTERFEPDAYGNNGWTNVTSFLTAQMEGSLSYDTFGCMYTNIGSPENGVMVTRTSVVARTDAFVAQMGHWDPQPTLKGVGTVTCKFRPTTTNAMATMSLSLFPTVQVANASSPLGVIFWQDLPNATFINTNNAFASYSYNVQTSTTWAVIFGATQNMHIAELSVSDWYAVDTANDGWIGHQVWMETPVGTNDVVCRMETSRTLDEQYLQSPVLTGGVDTVSFDYLGSTNAPASFQLYVSYTNPATWTNPPVVTVTGVTFTNTAYSNFTYSLNSSQPFITLRIKNTTPAPGFLRLNNVNATGYATVDDWFLNNASVKYMSSSNYPFPREFYKGALYLNTNRLASAEIGTGLQAPLTNAPPLLRTPRLDTGVGDVSFWYRNWALTPPIMPGRIVIQKSTTGGTLDAEWISVTGGTLTNIVNTNDYIYFACPLYDTDARYVRILSDDTNLPVIGRVCLDDVIVAAPLASSLTLTGLVVTPHIPLCTNTVRVSVDVSRLFLLSTTNVSLRALYGTATNYAELASAYEFELPMVCVSTNDGTAGKWYRYETTSSIPSYITDKYVKYYVSAAFTGRHSEVTSPKVQKQFGRVPTWYYPVMDYTNNQAYYVVYSCPTGSVWINEVNAQGYFTSRTNEEFVEVCGIAGADISRWTLDNIKNDMQTQAVYQVPSGTVLGASNAGDYGFWVIGGTSVVTRSATLTKKLFYPAGVRLRRSMGAIEHAVAWADDPGGVNQLTASGFVYIGSDPTFEYAAMSAVGEGTTANAFTTWMSEVDLTPGTTNLNQILLSFGPGPTNQPTIYIYSLWLNTNIWVECTRTNNWYPTPWHTTNLLDTNSWALVPSVTRSQNSSNYVLNFAIPTNAVPHFYKVGVTNSP